MGLKVFGPDLKSIEEFSLNIEQLLKEVPSVKPEAVYADRSLGKPYLEGRAPGGYSEITAPLFSIILLAK